MNARGGMIKMGYIVGAALIGSSVVSLVYYLFNDQSTFAKYIIIFNLVVILQSVTVIWLAHDAYKLADQVDQAKRKLLANQQTEKPQS